MDSQRLSIRFAIVALIVVAMLIPLKLVSGIAKERQRYYAEAESAVSLSWAGAQDFRGPFLLIPPETERNAGVGPTMHVNPRASTLILLPETLDITIHVEHELRQRAIYAIPVYRAKISAEGHFTVPTGELAEPGRTGRAFGGAILAMGLNETRAISSAAPLRWDEEDHDWRAGSTQEWLSQGIHVALPGLQGGEKIPFSYSFELKGSQSFSLLPVGARTKVTMTSSWPAPSFQGSHLPDLHQVTASGFEAHWNLGNFARDLPSIGNSNAALPSTSGGLITVRLHDPLTPYRIVERGIKYGVLFVALTYLTFLCFELSTAIRFHFIQYGVVGLALVLFYLSLLSLSEHIAFTTAYVLATTLLTGLIAWYVQLMSRSLKLSIIVFSVILSLYLVLYTLLRLEALSLLTGTGVLLIGLTALMYVTRGLGDGHEGNGAKVAIAPSE